MIRLTDQVTDAELDELKARGELVYKYGPQVWALKTARRDMRNHNLRKFINKHGLFLNTGGVL